MDCYWNRASGPCHRCTRSRSQSSALPVRPRTMDHRKQISRRRCQRHRANRRWIPLDWNRQRPDTFDGLNFRPVSFTSITTALNITILQLLTDARGTLWIRPEGAYLVSQKMASFRVSDTVIRNHRHVKDNHDGYWFRHRAGHIPVQGRRRSEIGPASPPVISLAETAEGKIWIGTLGDGLFLLTGGRLTKVSAGLSDRRSIVCCRSVKSCGSAPTRAFITGTATAFVGLNCRRSWVVSRF